MSKTDETALEELLDRLADGVLVLGHDGQTRYANATAAEFFGRPRRDLISRSFGLPTIVGGTTELEILRPDGTAVPVEVRASAMQYRGEHCVLASLRDSSERRKAQRALEESERRFRSAFESAGHGIGLLSLDGFWMKVNTAQCQMVGLAADSIIDTHISDLVCQQDLKVFTEQFSSLINGEHWTSQSELRLLNRRRETFPVFFSAGLVSDEDDEPLYIVAQLIDITRWRAAEEQLRQAQKTEMVGQLTGGIAHDFNNILGIVQGNLQLIQREVEADLRMSEQIGRALKATRRGAELTKRLLAFSRRQVLSPQVLNLNELVEDLFDLLQRTLGSDIEIALNLKGDLPSVRLDAAQMENVIINLCVNSRDAMSGGGRLTVETDIASFERGYPDECSCTMEGEYAVLSITDTGAGMTDEVRRHILEPFFTTKEAGKGTGLGMSMVYGFVKQSNGHIFIFSEIGVGTAVRLYFPVCDEKAVRYERSPDREQSTPTGTERILLVEDDADLRATLRSTLEMLGYSVAEAENGAAALAQFQAKPVDLLLTDVVMPGGISGPTLVRTARALDSRLPVLIQSGFAGRRNLIEGLELDERTAFLAKPCPHDLLARKIRDLLDAK